MNNSNIKSTEQIRYFPQSIIQKILFRPKTVIGGCWLIEDWNCKVCGNVLTQVHGDNDIGKCNKCKVNWLRNKTHDDWLRLNQL